MTRENNAIEVGRVDLEFSLIWINTFHGNVDCFIGSCSIQISVFDILKKYINLGLD